jgi:type II secretion system protein J
MTKRLSRRRPRRAGFTLIEILMASAAATLILVAIYGVFGKAMKLRDTATERARVSRLRNRAAVVIRNDLRNALVSGGKLAADLMGTCANEGREPRFPGYLRFTTTTARQDVSQAPSGDVQLVEYFIATDPEAGGREAGILMRAADRNLLATVPEDAPAEPLLKDVASLVVSFYDGQTWTDSWEVTEEEKTLPKAVRVRVIQAAAEGATAPPPLEICVPWFTEAAISP